MSYRLSATGIGLAMVLGLSACRPAADPPPPALVRAVELAAVHGGRPRLEVNIPAELRGYQEVVLMARVQGFVRHLYADRGSAVRQGQLLAELEAPELLAQRAEAESRLNSAQAQELVTEATLERDTATLQRLEGAAASDSGAVAGNDLQIARQAVAAAKAEVASRRAVEEAARHALAAQSTLEEYLHVRAPFAGMVTRRSVAEGALAGPGGAALFELAQSDPLRLVADVPEAETPGMHEGERMPFTVISRPGETFYGVLARPAHSLRRDSRTMPVEFDVANPHGDLVPGMFVQLKWSFQRDAAASMVPVTAVVRTAERTFVETLDGQQHVRWVDVTTGFSTGKEIEIFGPVELGSNVIVNASDEIHPGDTVNVVARPS